MRDAMLIGGDISLATKDTLATGTNTIQLSGTHNAKFRKTADSSGDSVHVPYCVFQLSSADLASGDSFYGVVSTCATVGGTYLPCGQTQTSAVAGKKGLIVRCPLPSDHLGFIRLDAMPKSTGTFTAVTVTAWIEYGVPS